MRILICFCALSILQLNAVLAETLTYQCNPQTNAGLRLKRDVTLTLSGLELAWTNGKLSQTAFMINPDDKLEFNTTDAKRVYLTDDSTSVLFVKRFDGYAEVLRTLVTVRESKQNKTTCHLDKQVFTFGSLRFAMPIAALEGHVIVDYGLQSGHPEMIA